MPAPRFARRSIGASVGVLLATTTLSPSVTLAQSPATLPAATQPATQPPTGTTTQATTQTSVQALQWLGEPTRVSLSLKDASPFDAFKALETASGVVLPLPNKEMFDRQTERRITAQIDNRSWLEAAVELADKANIRLSYFGGRWNVGFSGEARTTPRRHFIGPLLATCNRVIVDRELRPGNPELATQTLTLTGSLLAEPRVQSMQLERNAQLIDAVDDRGRALRAAPDDAASAAGPSKPQPILPGEPRRDFQILLQVPGDDATSVRRVRATLRVAVLSRTDALNVPDVLNAEGFVGRIGDATLKLERVEAVPQGYSLVMNVEPGSLPPSFVAGVRSNMPPFQPKIAANTLGVSTDVRVTGTGQRGDKSMQITLMVLVNAPRRQPPADGDPANDGEPNVVTRPSVDLSWPLPIEYQQVDVPIEFNDIPLPR